MISIKKTEEVSKKMNRKCAVCGKKIRITLYKDGHYINGNYFNKIKIPIGKGEYKKIRTSKLFGKKVDIVKWNGKEKEVEYWECNKCFEEASHEDWLEQTLIELYGERCPDYEKGCACCEAWEVYDTIIDANRGKL
jgi:hypothetical protein